MVIESSRMHAAGARVPLRFAPGVTIRGGPQGSGAVALFPGAVIAVKGQNSTGGLFMASEVLMVRKIFFLRRTIC